MLLRVRQRLCGLQWYSDPSAKANKAKRDKKKEKLKLSFADEEEEDVGDKRPRDETPTPDVAAKKVKLTKNPNVDTSFLPDREREAKEREEREELRTQWLAQQERIKDETIEITYSYWDGSGHRKVVEVSAEWQSYPSVRRETTLLRSSASAVPRSQSCGGRVSTT